jgi:Flagellar basal-body P-ring protein
MYQTDRITHKRWERARTLAVTLLFLAIMVAAGIAPAHAVRLKDIANFSGVRNNELVGYGLVVGLSGTGDGNTNEFTIRSMTNMLEKMGVSVNPTKPEAQEHRGSYGNGQNARLLASRLAYRRHRFQRGRLKEPVRRCAVAYPHARLGRQRLRCGTGFPDSGGLLRRGPGRINTEERDHSGPHP